MNDTKTLQRFLTYYEFVAQSEFDEILISQSMSEDPLLRSLLHIEGGDGQKYGKFMGKSVRVVGDVTVTNHKANNG